MIDKLHIFISLLAALIVTIVGLITGVPLFTLALQIISFIVVFYIVGFVIKEYLKHKVFVDKDKDEEAESDSGGQDGDNTSE